MEITGIEDIRHKGSSVDIVLSVEFDDRTANRWELADPKTLVVYTIRGETKVCRMELLDNGLKVHGYEFTDEEIKEIENYIRNNHIIENTQNRQNHNRFE